MIGITKHLPRFLGKEWFRKEFKPVRIHRTDSTTVIVEVQRYDGKMVLVLRSWIHHPDLARYSCYLHNKLMMETEEAEDMARWVATTMARNVR